MRKPQVKQKVWLKLLAAEKMLHEANDRYPLETGGILIGYFTETDVVVVDVIGPGPSAQHEADTFTPDYAWQDREVARLYKQSQRRYTYLGDWHTHPNGCGSLSMKDITTLNNIAGYRPARVPTPVMAILHGRKTWNASIWIYFSKGKERCVIEAIEEIYFYCDVP